MLQRGHALEAGQCIGVAASNQLLDRVILRHCLHADTAGEHQQNIRRFDGIRMLCKAHLQIVRIADIVGGDAAGHAAGIRQLLLKFIGGGFGEIDFPAAVAVDDEDLAANLGKQGFFCLQFGNQHITSSPLQRFCRS